MASSRPLEPSNTPSSVSDEHVRAQIDKFEPFAKLAPEIKERVWVLAARVPRVVRWGPAPPSAIFHTNHQSRNVALKEHSLVMVPFHVRSGKYYGIYINYKRDLLYRKASLPKPFLLRLERQWTFPGLRIAGTVWCPSWLRSVKRLAIPLDDAFILAKPCSPDPELWYRISCLFPELEELVTVLYPHMKAINVEDLEEIVPSLPIQSEAGKQELMMYFLEASIEDRGARGHGKPINLIFVKAKEGWNTHVTA